MRALFAGILFSVLSVNLTVKTTGQETSAFRQVSDKGITHGVLAFGAETFLLSGDGKILWSDPRGTRDGWLLPDGNILMTITKSDAYPGGGVVEVDKQGKTLFEYKGTQSEVNTSQMLPDHHIVLTEAGPNPRLLELDKDGKIVVQFPIQCQTQDFHMETRMARKLKNGHYLVPELLDKVVREYDKTGKVVWEVQTPNWAFQALRLDNGHTFITCTHGDMAIEVDKDGKTVWQLTNDDLPGAPLHDVCGAQRLNNGDTVLTCYGAGGENDIKLLEVTPDKKIVWTLYTGKPHGIHEFQIVEPDGRLLKGRTIR